MKLEFLLVPTTDLAASLAVYRELGFTEVWREGETTAAITLDGSATQIMLDASGPETPVGPILVVDSVTDFHAARPAALIVLADPAEIPGGFMASYQEPGGSVVHILDQSTEGGE